MSGSCWIDEVLTVDKLIGLPTVITTTGDDAGFAGLVACQRFEAEMAEGGAGGQAVALLPRSLTTPDGPTAFLATDAAVTDDGIVVTGHSR
jgi:hypothetical protein